MVRPRRVDDHRREHGAPEGDCDLSHSLHFLSPNARLLGRRVSDVPSEAWFALSFLYQIIRCVRLNPLALFSIFPRLWLRVKITKFKMNYVVFCPMRTNISQFKNKDISCDSINSDGGVQPHDGSAFLILSRHEPHQGSEMFILATQPTRSHVVSAVELDTITFAQSVSSEYHLVSERLL